MTSLVEYVASLFSTNSDMVFLGAIFAAVFLTTLAIIGIYLSKDAVRRRLDPDAKNYQNTDDQVDKEKASVLREDSPSFFDRMLKPLKSQLTPEDEGETSALRLRLIQAGYMSTSAPIRYYAARIILGFLLPIIIVFMAPAIGSNLKVETIMFMVGGAGIIGLYFPSLWVGRKVSARQLSAQEGFPDALDLLLVCVEAGLGINAALDRVGREIGRAHPVLSEALQFVGMELRAGKPRDMALRNMAERLGIDEVRSLVTMLIQSESLGTSIAQALRVHADDMRAMRMLRAEEKAMKLPVKLSFPLVMFILPCLILVIMTPAIIGIVRTVMPAMTGDAAPN